MATHLISTERLSSREVQELWHTLWHARTVIKSAESDSPTTTLLDATRTYSEMAEAMRGSVQLEVVEPEHEGLLDAETLDRLIAALPDPI